MAVAVPKPSSGSAVRIRINSLDIGTTRWKEGVFEIHEKDNKLNMIVKFNSGGAPRNFQLNNNVKSFVSGPMRTSHCRLVITLKDSKDVVTFDKIPTVVAKKMKEYLDSLKQGKQTIPLRQGKQTILLRDLSNLLQSTFVTQTSEKPNPFEDPLGDLFS